MIEVKNLVKCYGDCMAVDHLNFKMESGSIYGLLGPNGAGKSTTMNMMTGYLGMSEGEVLIEGHNILEEPEEAKKQIGYLPELPPIYLDMTVREYLQFAAELKQVKKAEQEQEIEKVMQLTKLADVSGRLTKNLSKGYKQRVGLAQAILGFPPNIILDEPTVGLDPKQMMEMRELLRELAKNHTVILSSHILAEVQAICDYVLIISQGKLVASDTPDNLENLVKGQETVEMIVRTEKKVLEQILDRVPFISEIDYEGQECDTDIRARVTAEEGCSIQENLAIALANEKIPVLHLDTTKTTLEDVFLELTQPEEGESNHDSNL